MTTARIQENDAKFRELILLIAVKSEGDSYFGETKLNMLLFYIDFLSYLELGLPITGQKYQKLAWGSSA